ncbi:MAG: M20/M25/M40 family metallo-hydrolase [Clostridia bacterium]|nr:M20/M25/M40 family metallo-hydrolase [Clostridia bacterium]
MVTQERLLSEFLNLLQINSPSKGERELADFLINRLSGLGMEVEEDGAGAEIGGSAGNVIGRWAARVKGAPSLLLAAHMDTVESTAGINLMEKDDKIFTNGTTILGADDKAGIAAILEALRVVREKGLPHGEITVVFTVAEEVGLLGAKSLQGQGLRADLGYVLDSGGPVGTVINHAPAEEDIRIEVFGRSAHAGVNPEEGINAIQVAGAILTQLPMGRLDEESTANIGVIRGGKATNIVPDYVEMQGEIRSRDEVKLNKLVEEWREIVADTASKLGSRANYNHERVYQSFKVEPNHPVIKVVETALKEMDLPMNIKPRGGGSDTNIFNAMGIPSINLGIGMEKNHSPEEYINKSDLFNAACLVLSIINTAAKQQDF